MSTGKGFLKDLSIKILTLQDIEYHEVMAMIKKSDLSAFSSQIVDSFSDIDEKLPSRLTLSQKQTHILGWKPSGPFCFTENEALVVGLNILFH